MSMPEFAGAGLQNNASVPTHVGLFAVFAPTEPPAFNYRNRPISSFGLSRRASNALTRAGISTAGDVVQWTVRDLRTLPGFGPASVIAVQSVLGAMGLSLREAELIFGR